MRAFHELLRKTTSSSQHDSMQRFVRPLKEHFGISHFWWYRVTESGHYTYLGSHTEWNEYCFENHLISQFPLLRHPSTQKSGIQLMRNTSSQEYRSVQKEAWEKFHINFGLNLSTKITDGVEAFGLATKSDHPSMDEFLLHELPLFRRFIQLFRTRHRKLMDLALDNQVNISDYLGQKFHEGDCFPLFDRQAFLKEMGWLPMHELTPREKEILQHLLNGYPSSYIAQLLFLRKRTVENYIATIKCKLFCRTKVELIHKAKDLTAIHYL